MDLVSLEIHLDLLMTELLEHVIEHNLGHVIVGGDFKSHDLTDTELMIGWVGSPLFERNEGTSLVIGTVSAFNE